MSSEPAPSAKDFNDSKLEALIEMMFLAAHADGEFSQDERGHFAESIQSLSDGRIAGPRFDALLERIQADLAASSREARLGTVKERLVDAPSRKVALSLAIQVMASDGVIRTTERELILEVAEALEIDRDVAANLVKEISK
jgi:tellurite resistance protein